MLENTKGNTMNDIEEEVTSVEDIEKISAEDLEAGMSIDLSGDKYADPANEGWYDEFGTYVSEVRYEEIDGEEIAIAECVYNHEWFTVYFPLDHQVTLYPGVI